MKNQITKMDLLLNELNELRVVKTHSEQTADRLEVLELFFNAYGLCSDVEKGVVSDIINTKRSSCMHLRIRVDVSKKMSANSQKNILKFGARSFNMIFEEKDILCNVNFDYENKINNKLDREGKSGDFQVQSRVWGRHVTNGIVVNGNTLYLSLSITHTENKVFFNENGGTVLFSEYDKWLLPSKRPEYMQAKAQERQGTDEAVNYINLKTQSILKMYHNSKIFDVEKGNVIQR